MKPNKKTAIYELAPNCGFSIKQDGEIVDWVDNGTGISQPTEEEINTELSRQQTEYDAKDYARKREVEYPTIQECVHAILDDDLENLQILRQTIKTKYPKI